jgi:hypothetical protein
MNVLSAAPIYAGNVEPGKRSRMDGAEGLPEAYSLDRQLPIPCLEGE